MREKTIVKFAESIYNVSLELWDSLKRKGGQNEGEFVEEVGEQLKRFQDTFDQLQGQGQGKGEDVSNNSQNQSRNQNHNNNYEDAPKEDQEYYADEHEQHREQPQVSPRGHREIVSKMSSLAQLDIGLVKKDLENLAVSR